MCLVTGQVCEVEAEEESRKAAKDVKWRQEKDIRRSEHVSCTGIRVVLNVKEMHERKKANTTKDQ